MIFDYIVNNFEKDEPFFLSELPGESKGYIRQEMKRLTDEGKLCRLYNGVYFLSYNSILGTKGKVSVDKYINKKYIKNGESINGYITGMQLANMYGFTTQNPSCTEVCSNEATTKQRKFELDGRKIVVYKPPVKIDKTNVAALQFLDLMTNIDKYSELTGNELKRKLRDYVKNTKVDFKKVKKYISLFPDRVYKNIYSGGLMGELV